MATLSTYPLDNTDYAFEDAALFHSTRTTGIFAGDDFSYSLTGADNTIKLEPGLAWMRLARFKGVVAALKQTAYVDMGLPDSVFPRIDHVVLQLDANKNDTQVVVKNGVASSNPLPPARSTTEALYEIHLLRARREPGATAITAADVTDLRLDVNYCGLMADSVTRVDTSAINAQITSLIEQLREEIANVKAGTAYVMKSGDTMTGNLSMGGNQVKAVAAPTDGTDAANKDYVDGKHLVVTTTIPTGWSGSAAPYTQTITVAGITANDRPHISPVYSDVLETALAQKEAWGMVSRGQAGNGVITFNCFEDKPSAEIPIQIEVNR